MPATQTYVNGVGRTQQEAVAGIREMQSRVRSRYAGTGSRNWSTEPGIPRSDRTPRRVDPVPEPAPPPEPAAAPFRDRQQSHPSPYPQQVFQGQAQQGDPQQGYGNRQAYGSQQNVGNQRPFSQQQQPRRGIFLGVSDGLSSLFGAGNRRRSGPARQNNRRGPYRQEPQDPSSQGPGPQNRPQGEYQGTQTQNPSPQQSQYQEPPPQNQPRQGPQQGFGPDPQSPRDGQPQQGPRHYRDPQPGDRGEPRGPAAPQPPGEGKSTTLLQDILNGIGLDDDRILILGLILILVNDKADTTLILALLYLLL